MSALETPMMRQYLSLKQLHPDALLFFRMGDFYEVFLDDAVTAARELELTLTSRNAKDDDAIPMAGVPHHAADRYIEELVAKGYRVAIADQMEDPALAKGLVRREITRVVTPGVALDPTRLEARAATWLVGVCGAEQGLGVAFLELSTGDLRVTSLPDAPGVIGEIHRMEPREALIEPGLAGAEAIERVLARAHVARSRVEAEAWSPLEARRELRVVLGRGDLGVPDGHPGLRAAGALLRYAREMSGGAVRNVHEVRAYEVEGFMVLDDTSTRNLEIHRTLLGGKRRGSLLGLLDETATAMGSRKLREWLAFPLLDLDGITRRQHAVAVLADDSGLRDTLRRALREVADIERLGARITQGTAHARDLAALRRSLRAAPEAVAPLRDALPEWVPDDVLPDVHDDLAAWLVDDPPISLTDGGLIRRGASAELDAITRIAVEGIGVIGELQERERQRTGIGSLKISRNAVFGYFIEITRAHWDKPLPDDYVRKQTLSNAERYVTPELKELEETVLGADEKRKALEYTLFAGLRDRVAAHSARLLALARRLAELDVVAALAEVAVRWRWARPDVDDSTALVIEGGRHPVVEATLEEERFVPNDVDLDTDERRLVVLTGPNMAGKSTVMRQVALVVLLAQIGSFVPADRARIGRVDRIFTRVGAADDLTRGQSTFMVEMAETANILHHATVRSLVLLDEIGRGTSTYDGLSIAWAVAEDLHDRVRCRTLFATHYHELCELALTRDGVVNQSIAVREWGDRIVFLRKLKEGGASRSYGIQCARLAGLPVPVIDRAKSLLTRFEKHAPRDAHNQMSLFGTAGPPSGEAPPPPATAHDPVRDALAALDPDTMAPREALDALYVLKGLLG